MATWVGKIQQSHCEQGKPIINQYLQLYTKKTTGAAYCGHNKKNPARKITIILYGSLPVHVHGHKQEKAQSSCAVACHGCKQKTNNQTVQPLAATSNKKNKQPLQPAASATRTTKEQSTCELGAVFLWVGKQTISGKERQQVTNLCLWVQTCTHTKQSTCAACHSHNKKQSRTTIIWCSGLPSWPMAASKKQHNHPVQQSVMTASKQENKTKQNKTTVNLCMAWPFSFFACSHDSRPCTSLAFCPQQPPQAVHTGGWLLCWIFLACSCNGWLSYFDYI